MGSWEENILDRMIGSDIFYYIQFRNLPVVLDGLLLSKLSRCGWKVLNAYLKQAVSKDDAKRGATITVHTFGDFQEYFSITFSTLIISHLPLFTTSTSGIFSLLTYNYFDCIQLCIESVESEFLSFHFIIFSKRA